MDINCQCSFLLTTSIVLRHEVPRVTPITLVLSTHFTDLTVIVALR